MATIDENYFLMVLFDEYLNISGNLHIIKTRQQPEKTLFMVHIASVTEQ